MDYNDVPLFVRVVESGSFTAAADALGVQKSSVSRSVSRLERELGVRLLQRTTRKLALTDAGKAFFDRVQRAMFGVDEAANAVRELGSEPRGIVRITAPPDAYAFGMAEGIASFCQEYPHIHVECVLTVRRVDLVAEGFDLAVRGGRMEDSTLVARRLEAPPFVLFAAPAYLRRRKRPKALSDLARHDCVLFQAHAGRTTWTLAGPKGAETVTVKGPISVDEMSFAMHACVAGLGVAMLPISLAYKPAERGELEQVLPDYTAPKSELRVVLPSSAFVPARVLLLRDHLIAHLQREIAQSTARCSKHRSQKAR